MSADRVRVGVVGVRFGAQVHVPAFRSDPRCVVAAVAGRDALRAEMVAAELGIPAFHADWRALVADASIDAVSIAVPPLQQAAIVEQAAGAGKHVFCEKPVSVSVAEAERALACANRACIVHAVNFIFPDIPAWQLARKLVQGGAIGAPRHFSYSWKVQTFAVRTKADSWKNRTADGGGARGNFLPHVIYNLEWLLGPLARMEALPRRGAAAAFCDCIVQLENGVHGVISISTDALLGGGHQLHIFGECGTLLLSNSTTDYAGGFEVNVGMPETGRFDVAKQQTECAGADGRIGPAGKIVSRFLDGILEGTPVHPSLEDGVHVQRWVARVIHAGAA